MALEESMKGVVLHDRLQVIAGIIFVIFLHNFRNTCEASLVLWMEMFGGLLLFNATCVTLFRISPALEATATPYESEDMPVTLSLVIRGFLFRVLPAALVAMVVYGWIEYGKTMGASCIDEDHRGEVNPQTLALVFLIIATVACCFIMISIFGEKIADDEDDVLRSNASARTQARRQQVNEVFDGSIAVVPVAVLPAAHDTGLQRELSDPSFVSDKSATGGVSPLATILYDRLHVVLVILLLSGAQRIMKTCQEPLAVWMALSSAVLLFNATFETVSRMFPVDEALFDEGAPDTAYITLKVVLGVTRSSVVLMMVYGWIAYAVTGEEDCADQYQQGDVNPRTLVFVYLLVASIVVVVLGSCLCFAGTIAFGDWASRHRKRAGRLSGAKGRKGVDDKVVDVVVEDTDGIPVALTATLEGSEASKEDSDGARRQCARE